LIEATYTRTHLSERVEDAVENYKQRENTLNRLQGTSDDETKNSPEEKAESHGLLAADSVHEQSANDGTREVETVHNSAVANVLNQGVVGVELSNNGGAENAKGISL
jgi:hypothetical protein